MASVTTPERMLVLIIGINDYPGRSKLNYCINDAMDIGEKLKSINFQVTTGIDCDKNEFHRLINSFVAKITTRDLILFFFAGHGVQFDDKNYLLPSGYSYDHSIEERKYIDGNSINAQYILHKTAGKHPYATIFILDCCRIHVKTRGGESQMAAIVGPPESLLAFSCGFNQGAVDETQNNRNSIFTECLLKHMTMPNQDFETILQNVARDVKSRGIPLPWRSSCLTEKIYLVIETPKVAKTKSTRASTATPSIDKTINILLVGETGVGKSTFINAFVNYLTHERFEQAQRNRPVIVTPVSFFMTLPDTFQERLVKFGDFDGSNDEDFHHPGQSITQRCKSYIFRFGRNGEKKLCIIDTPGFGDLRGIDQDEMNMQQILQHISDLTHINAVCFLFKPDATQLNPFFLTCFTRLLNYLGENVRNNIIFCFTHARSTFFMPGNIVSLIRNMFRSLSINDIALNKLNTFLFDNESFRYLIALQNGISFNDEDKCEYEENWSSSVNESNRLLNYVCNTLTAYRIQK